MAEQQSNKAALQQAQDCGWLKMRKRPIGDGLGGDSRWLDNFNRQDVLIELPGAVIMNTKPRHAEDVVAAFRAAYGLRPDETCDDCFETEDVLAQLDRFPAGQFAAQCLSGPNAGQAVGMAVTMRTSRPPAAPILSWREAIGDMTLSAHEPDGEWLYGVEMAVRTSYQGWGIGTALYAARFDLVKTLKLRGWYAVGMLMGYQNHADAMDVREYGEKVMAREIKDPTVSLQLKLGFRAGGLVTNYVDEPAAGDAGVLIVWDNPEYREAADG